MATSTKGTIFYEMVGTGTPVATQIKGMMTKPALPGLPNSIESTSQEELMQSFVDGVQQLGDANFQFKYMPYGASSTNFKHFIELQTADVPVAFGIEYPDGTAVTFKAVPFVQRDATGVNALDTFTVAMMRISDLDIDATAPLTIEQPA